MAVFTLESWAVLGVVGGAGLLACAYVLAAALRDEVRSCELRRRVGQLRRQHFPGGMGAGQEEIIEVEPVEE